MTNLEKVKRGVICVSTLLSDACTTQMPGFKERVPEKLFWGPTRHLTGLPEADGTSILSKRCLNPFLGTAFAWKDSTRGLFLVATICPWVTPEASPCYPQQIGGSQILWPWRGPFRIFTVTLETQLRSADGLGDTSSFLRGGLLSAARRTPLADPAPCRRHCLCSKGSGLASQTHTHSAAAMHRECRLHWFYVWQNWRKYLIKPVNFYTDNKNVSTDINVNKTK